jgi:hypothetical protein
VSWEDVVMDWAVLAPLTPDEVAIIGNALESLVENHKRHADALIEIATWFGDSKEGVWCWHCGHRLVDGCAMSCPGLLARRALGVA